MSEIKFTKLSSKGQIVIPKEIREKLNISAGTPFVVIAKGNSVLLKKVEKPKIKDLGEATKPFRSAAEKSGFTKKDMNRLIEEARAGKTQKIINF